MLAFGAMPVAAGVITVMALSTMVAMPGLPAQFGGTASADIPHGFKMAGQDVGLMLALVLGSVLADDVRQ